MRSEQDKHEKKIEKFYSTGQGIANLCDNEHQKEIFEFLSFGYWYKNTKSYLDAAVNLIDYVISRSTTKNPYRVLNITCGYGAETFIYYDKIKPEMIDGLDITKKHVDYANNKAKQLKLNDKIRFYYGDAVNLAFPDNIYSQIIGIEGPVHFSCRKKFFKSAFRVLKPGGELILTDIIGKNTNAKTSKYLSYLTNTLAWLWQVPRDNLISDTVYREQLKDSHFEIIDFQKIGGSVFPGYAMNGFNLKTIKIRIMQRGFFAAIGLTLISMWLGILYKNGMIDYIFLRAMKST